MNLYTKTYTYVHTPSHTENNHVIQLNHKKILITLMKRDWVSTKCKN